MPIVMMAAGPKPKALPENADEVGTPLRFLLLGGNECLVTPAMKRTGRGQCNITVCYEWEREPTALDKKDVEDEIARMFNAQPAVLHRGTIRRPEVAKALAESFLEGKKAS
jgi:hypothetical protein